MSKTVIIGTGFKSVFTASFNTETGNLEITGEIPTGKAPTWVQPESQNRFFAVNEFDDKIQLFENKSDDDDESNKKWKCISEFSSLGATPCHLSLSADKKTLVCANYNQNASIFSLSASLSPSSSIALHFKDASFLGKDDVLEKELGPQKDRQGDGSHPHMATFSPHFNNPQLLLVPDLGTDSILRVDSCKQQQQQETEKSPSSSFEIVARTKCSKPGRGPRHLVFHPILKNRFYLVNELESSITVYDLNEETFAMTELETVSCLPPGKSSFDFGGSLFKNDDDDQGGAEEGVQQNTCASINFLPRSNGKFLYVSCRGRNSIRGFELDEKTGLVVKNIGEFSSLGRTPRFFCFSEDGKFVLVCNQDSGSIFVFKVVLNEEENVFVFDTSKPVCAIKKIVESPQCIGFL
jgi:6-phosphogluconolactonase